MCIIFLKKKKKNSWLVVNQSGWSIKCGIEGEARVS